MYFKGEGVPEDYEEAYGWFNIAAAQGHTNAEKARNLLRTLIASEQVQRAQPRDRELAAGKLIKWQPSKPRQSAKTHKANSIVRDIQSALSAKGYNPGSIDGKMGRKTRLAIRAFQRKIGLPPNGRASPELLMLIRAQ